MNKSIDYNKCVGCLKCVRDCVVNHLLVCDDTQDVRYNKPVFVDKGRCIECGHCEAICPNQAVITDNCSDFDESDGLLRQMSLKRTVRDYIKNSTIEKKILDNIILAGQSAPTDRNRKTCRIILIKEKLGEVYNLAVDWLVSEVEKTGTINPLYKSTIAMAANRDTVLWNAEYLVAIVGNTEYVVDAAITAERMQLEADCYGIGTGYRGDIKKAINNNGCIREIIGIKPREEVLVTFAMGMTNCKYYRSNIKQNRKVVYL